MLLRQSRSHRIASMCVVALLAANGAVLASGLADAVETLTAASPARTIAIITNPDGTQTAVDPSTPAGWKAIADAKENGATVTTVEVPDSAAATGGTGARPTIPGIDADDLQRLLGGTVDHIVTTVRTIIDETGKTVVSIVDGTLTTVSSIVEDTKTTASSVVDDTKSTLDSVIDDTQTTVDSVVDETQTTVSSVVEVVNNLTTTTTAAPTTTTSNVTVPVVVTVTTLPGGTPIPEPIGGISTPSTLPLTLPL